MNEKQKEFKILIVDDERANIMALTHILKSEYTVLAAIGGKMGIDAAKKNKPDLILLDIIMPDMSGFEVLIKLKESDDTRAIPVIFITGLDSTEDEEKGLFLGAVDYITKPFRDSIVKARVKTHLQIVQYIYTIERLGMIDTLTNIPNRRSFDNQLKEEWGRAIREQTPIGMLMIDVDNFKAYNDTYGHPQGDVLLHAISETFGRVLKRSVDFAARWGGEEFAVLLPNTGLSGTLDVAEQIRTHIEQKPIHCADGTITSITVSIGACSMVPGIDDMLADFIRVADKALYAAKDLGKNMVCSGETEEVMLDMPL